MKSEWCYWKQYFTKDFCERVTSRALELEPSNPLVEDSTGNFVQKNEMRKCSIRWIDPSDSKFTFLYDAIWRVSLQMNREWFNFHITDLPPLQFTEYDSSYQGEYKKHQDIFWINSTNNHRKLSIVMQLSDDSEYDNCDLQFEMITTSHPSEKEIRAQGTIIAFPSFVYHKVTPITRGKRYSLVGWFEGPKFV